MDLVIGRRYSKAEFGITGNAEKQWSEITVGGELFTFFSSESHYNNISEDDGFVYEGRGIYAVIPESVRRDLHTMELCQNYVFTALHYSAILNYSNGQGENYEYRKHAAKNSGIKKTCRKSGH
jgi:hypothetical protein